MRTIEIPALAGSRLTTSIEIPDDRWPNPDVKPPRLFVTWRIMTPKDGDTKIVWNPDSFTEIREAAALFKKLVAAGMVPYVCDATGRPTGEVMQEFDPSAGEVDFRDVVWAPTKLAAGG